MHTKWERYCSHFVCIVILGFFGCFSAAAQWAVSSASDAHHVSIKVSPTFLSFFQLRPQSGSVGGVITHVGEYIGPLEYHPLLLETIYSINISV